MSYLGLVGSYYMFSSHTGLVHGVRVLKHPDIGKAYEVAFVHFYG